MGDEEILYYVKIGISRKDLLHYAHIGIDKEIKRVRDHAKKNKKLKLKSLEIAKQNLVKEQIKEL